MYERTPEGEITHSNISTRVLKGDRLLVPYLFIIVLDYALRTEIDEREGLTLIQPVSSLI